MFRSEIIKSHSFPFLERFFNLSSMEFYGFFRIEFVKRRISKSRSILMLKCTIMESEVYDHDCMYTIPTENLWYLLKVYDHRQNGYDHSRKVYDHLPKIYSLLFESIRFSLIVYFQQKDRIVSKYEDHILSTKWLYTFSFRIVQFTFDLNIRKVEFVKSIDFYVRFRSSMFLMF